MSRFFSSDDTTVADWLQVAETAGLLEVTEFELFRLAYRDWYGRAATEADLEAYFTPFMFADVVPFWLRRYCARIRAESCAGQLDPVRLGIPRLVVPAHGLRWLIIAVILLLLLPAGLLLLSDLASDLMPFLSECYFPPCY
jgi:hypothetical protein